MSSALYCKPVKKEGTRIKGVAIKSILQNKFGMPLKLNRNHGDYLQGLADAGVEGAAELIEEICLHSEIEIWLEY